MKKERFSQKEKIRLSLSKREKSTIDSEPSTAPLFRKRRQLTDGTDLLFIKIPLSKQEAENHRTFRRRDVRSERSEAFPPGQVRATRGSEKESPVCQSNQMVEKETPCFFGQETKLL